MASLVDFAQQMGQQATDVTKGLAGLAETKRLTDYQQQQIGLEQQRFGLAQQEQQSMFAYRKAEMDKMQQTLGLQARQFEYTMNKNNFDETAKVHSEIGTSISYENLRQAGAKINIVLPEIPSNNFDEIKQHANAAIKGFINSKNPGEGMKYLAALTQEVQMKPWAMPANVQKLTGDFITLEKQRMDLQQAMVRMGVMPEGGAGENFIKNQIDSVKSWEKDPNTLSKPVQAAMVDYAKNHGIQYDPAKFSAGQKIYANPKMQDFMARTENLIEPNGALDNLKNVRDLTPDSGIKFLNGIINDFELQFGNKAVAALEAQGLIAHDEASKLMGSGQGAVGYFNAAQKAMSTASTKEQTAAIVDTLKTNLKGLYASKGRDTKFEQRFQRLGIGEPSGKPSGESESKSATVVKYAKDKQGKIISSTDGWKTWEEVK